MSETYEGVWVRLAISFLIVIAVAGCGREGVAQAPSPQAEIFGRAPLEESVPAINAGGISLQVSKPADIVTGRATFGSRASTGWHIHPGPGLVQVKSGTMTMFNADCSKSTFAAGKALVDRPNELLLARNDGEQDLIILLTFVLPKGADLSTPRRAPRGCPEA